MAKRYRPDRLLLVATLGLLSLGVVMVFSASAVYAAELYDNVDEGGHRVLVEIQNSKFEIQDSKFKVESQESKVT